MRHRSAAVATRTAVTQPLQRLASSPATVHLLCLRRHAWALRFETPATEPEQYRILLAHWRMFYGRDLTWRERLTLGRDSRKIWNARVAVGAVQGALA